MIWVANVVLDSEVEKESEPVVVRPRRLLALALLILALKQLKLSEPLINSVGDFRPTSFVLIVNNRDVGVESLEVCLLALSGCDRFVEIFADVFPRSSAVSQRVRRK